MGLFDDVLKPENQPQGANQNSSSGLFDDVLKPVKPGIVRSSADSALALGKGVASGVKMVADAAGANNAVSRAAGSVADTLGGLESDYAKGKQQQAAQRMQDAEASGSTVEEFKAGFQNFADRPVDMLLEGIGSSAPTLAATALTRGKINSLIANRAVGAIQGAGSVKGQIYEDVERRHREAGATPEQAAQKASESQAYTGQNRDQIALGAGLGALAGSTGAEASVGRIVQGVAPKAKGIVGSMVKGGLSEFPMEAAQGGQERLASNIASQREGFNVNTLQGVAGQGVTEGLAGFGSGATFGAGEHIAHRRAQAVETLNDPNAGPLSKAAATGELSGANMQAAAEAAQAAQAEQAAEADKQAKAGDNAIDFEKVPLPDNRRTLALAEDQPVDQNSIDFTPGNRVLTAQQGLENLQYFGSLRNGYPLETLQRMLPELNAGDKKNTIIPHVDGGYTLAPTHLLSPGVLKSVEALQPVAPQAAQPALGYNPTAGTHTVFPDGSVVLNSDTPEGEQRVFDKRYAPQPSDAKGVKANGKTATANDGAQSQAAPATQSAAAEAGETVTAQDGKPFSSKITAGREMNKRGLSASHEVVQAGEKGYVVRKKAQEAGNGETTDVRPGIAGSDQPGSVDAAAGVDAVLGRDAEPVSSTAVEEQAASAEAGTDVTGAESGATDALSQAAHEAATSPQNDLPEPTQAQKEAGNYKKGHTRVHGLDISIENPAGSTRSGVDRDGKPWENQLRHHYGYIKRTEGADGDHVDTFIGPNPESQKVFVVDQVDPATGKFDEHKVMMGFDSLKEAKQAYQANYAKGWKGGKQITETTVDQFKDWLANGDTKAPFGGKIASKTAQTAPDDGKTAPESGKAETKSAESETAPQTTPQNIPENIQPSGKQDAAQEDSNATAVNAPAENAPAVPDDNAATAADERVAVDDRTDAATDAEVAETATAEAKKEPRGVLAKLAERKAAKPNDKPVIPEAKPARGVLAKKAVAEEKARKEAPKIEDFGEKIGGARKDVWTSFKDDLNAVPDDEIANQPLSKVWPAPDYQALIDNGTSLEVTAAVRALRDEVPAKPRASWKVSRWSEQVKMLRNFANDIMDGKITLDQLRKEMMKGTSAMRGLLGRIELYQAVGHSKSLEGISLLDHHYTLYKGKENVYLWAVEQKAAATAFSNWPREIATGATKEEAIANFKAKYDSLHADKVAKQPSFDIYSERGTDGYFVGKKIGRNYAKLEGPFLTVKEARQYRDANATALQEKLEKFKELPRERRDINEPRVGEDMRNGQDVTPQLFADAFGFKGVEFGNWVEQGKRQKDLNEAYDALMDMAAILNVQPKALSLNGELGLAFGARGSGGVNPAAAHYERDKIVINLTKKSGAGSLGHEWWHALDNYFSRMRANPAEMMTTSLDVSLSSRGSNYVARGEVRKEMIDAFGAVMKSIKDTAIKARSAKLDAKRTKEYWTTNPEMSARAFESYLISKLQDQNASNDYLANIVDPETWKAAEALGFELDDSYPYPTAGEIPAIRAGFDQFFQTIQTKETDKGIALYDRGGMFSMGMPVKEVQGEVDRIAASWKNAPKINVVESVYDLPFDAPSDARGVYAKGQVWMVAENNQTAFDVQAVLFHEVLGHAGLRGLFGDQLNNELRAIALKNKNVRELAAAWRAQNADLRSRYGDSRFGLIAIEEALADIAGEGKTIKGWQRFAAAMQKALRAIGLTDLANWLENRTDAEVHSLLASARQYIERGQKQHVFGTQEAAAYSLSGDRRPRIDTDDNLVNIFAEIAKQDDAFRLPDTKATKLDDVFADMMPGATVDDSGNILDFLNDEDRQSWPVDRSWVIRPSKNADEVAYVYRNNKAKEVWLDISNWKEGAKGYAVYQSVATWAHNNGYTFIGDPAGLSDKALYRRTEQMISSALRHGTTQHLAPHARQVEQSQTRAGQDIRPLKWIDGDDANNLREMLISSYSNIKQIFPEIDDVTFNFTTGQFERAPVRASGGALLADESAGGKQAGSDGLQQAGSRSAAERGSGQADEGRGNVPRVDAVPFTDADFKSLRKSVRDAYDVLFPSSRGAYTPPIGVSDLKRAIITASVLRSESSETGRALLDYASRRLLQRVSSPQLESILYSRGSILGATESLRSSATLREATDNIKSLFSSDRKFNLWDRTIGTQFNKATKDADFRRVFDALNQQTDDTAHYAIEAERLAPHVLQRLESVKDIGKALLQGGGQHKADMEAIAKPLFANIEGEAGIQQKVYSNDELARDFGLTPRQIEMYREVRLAVDTSIDRLAQSTIAAMGQSVGMDINELKGLSLEDTARAVKEGTEDGVVGRNLPGMEPTRRAELHARIDELLEHAAHLKQNGYMPAMRFGRYAVTVTGKDGDIAFFGMYESQFAANVAKKQLAKDPEYAGMHIESSVMNPDAFAMFQGVSPETVELFGKFMGMEDNEAFQEYIALAKSARSSMKRMLERKGVAGFSDDVGRVLASFITSNARQSAQHFNNTEINNAYSAIPREKGDVQQEAQRLIDYIKNPREEAQALRGFLFMHFMGGSVASAATNLTQPVLQTAPYLSQFAGKNLASIMASSAKMAATQQVDNAELRAALDRAAADGITEPHEIHQLMADASGSALGTSMRARALTKAWGGFFALSEAYNRRLTFLAAYQTAMGMGQAALREKGFADAYAFAQRAIIETQGLYSKTNRPNWARGPVMATVFTFKQFSIAYIEFFNRLPKQQKAIALAVLLLAAGLQGLPFADDIEDLIDTIGQSMGYATNSKKALRETMRNVFGDTVGSILTHGLSSQTGVDLQGRLGLGNLIPGTGILKTSTTDKFKDMREFVGPVGGVLESFMNAYGKLWSEGVFGAMKELAPLSIRNAIKGIDTAEKGYYTDSKGRRVMDTTALDAFFKFFGFQPERVAAESRILDDFYQDRELVNNVESAIAGMWARGLAAQDPEQVEEARQKLAEWNMKNPGNRIKITPVQIQRRVREIRQTRAERFIKSTPKDARATVKEGLQ